MTSPAGELVEPLPKELVPDLVNQLLSFPDLISPTHWMLWAMETVCGVNPAKWAAEQFVGDWESFSKAGSALANLANFNGALMKALDDGSDRMLGDWQGNAAHACNQYFDEVSAALREQMTALDAVAEQFHRVAQGINTTASLMASLLEMLADALLALALEAAAGAASTPTVVGPVLAGAAAAFTLTKAMGVWGEIINAHSRAWTLVQIFFGLCAGYLGALKGMENVPLPAGAYDHKGA
jgi:uncharacterized protein YukE